LQAKTRVMACSTAAAQVMLPTEAKANEQAASFMIIAPNQLVGDTVSPRCAPFDGRAPAHLRGLRLKPPAWVARFVRTIFALKTEPNETRP
jgi:hypothetical protein